MLNYDTLGVEIKQPEICCTTAKEHPYNVSPNILFLRYDDALTARPRVHQREEESVVFVCVWLTQEMFG